MHASLQKRLKIPRGNETKERMETNGDKNERERAYKATEISKQTNWGWWMIEKNLHAGYFKRILGISQCNNYLQGMHNFFLVLYWIRNFHFFHPVCNSGVQTASGNSQARMRRNTSRPSHGRAQTFPSITLRQSVFHGRWWPRKVCQERWAQAMM